MLVLRVQHSDQPPEVHQVQKDVSMSALQRAIDHAIETHQPLQVLLQHGEVLENFRPWEAQRVQLLQMPKR
jgi:formyltetrahydrofolate hydrolase